MSKDHKEKDKKHKKKVAYETFRRGKDEVAPVLDTCLGWLERNAIDAEGLFRVSGAVREVEDLLKQFEKAQTSGKKVDLSKVKDPHVVAGVTKAWLRELSDPLLTFELYDCFVATASVGDTEARVACVARIISYLPPGNRATLKRLCQFLRLVEMNSARNRMNASNLAICFAPNVLRAKDQNPLSALNEMQAANTLLMTMITFFDVIFLKKEFPKAQEALHKLPEKEKNDIERKFRTGTVRLALAETEDLFDEESDESSGSNSVSPAIPAHHHHHARPALAGVFEQPGSSTDVKMSPRDRGQAAPPAPVEEKNGKASEASKTPEKKEGSHTEKKDGSQPETREKRGGSQLEAMKEESKTIEEAPTLATDEEKPAMPVNTPTTNKPLAGGVRMVGAGIDMTAVKLKPRPNPEPGALPAPLSPHKVGASTRVQPKATLPPPLEKRKSSEAKPPAVASSASDDSLPPIPSEPLPVLPTRPAPASATPAASAVSLPEDLPPIPDEPLPLPPAAASAQTGSASNPAVTPASGSGAALLSPRVQPAPAALKAAGAPLPAPIASAAAAKSKLPSVRRAPPPVPLIQPEGKAPSPFSPINAAPPTAPTPSDQTKPQLISPKSAKPPPPLVSPRPHHGVPTPAPRDLPPPPVLVAPSLLLGDKEKEKEKEKDKEKEPNRDVPLEKLAEWLLEGRKDDVALYLSTLPEADAKEKRIAVKELLAKKLAELDTLG